MIGGAARELSDGTTTKRGLTPKLQQQLLILIQEPSYQRAVYLLAYAAGSRRR